MPVNEFENKVQQKMDELKLQPSPEVWEQVELRIRKDKKRRRFIFWLPLLGLLLAGTGVYLYLDNSSNNSSISESTHQNQFNSSPTVNSKKETGDQNNSVATNGNDQPVTSQINTESPVNVNGDNDPPVNNQSSLGSNQVKHPDISKSNLPSDDQQDQFDAQASRPTIIKNKRSTPVANNNSKGTVISEPPTRIQTGSESIQQPVPVEKEIPPALTEKKEKKDEEIISESGSNRKTVKLEQQDLKEEKKKDDKDQKTKPWSWGLQLNAGRSKTIRNLSLFSGNSSGLSTSIGSGPGSGGFTSFHNVNSATSFGFGAFARRNISDRLYLNLGIDYSLLRTSELTGMKNSANRVVNNSFSDDKPISSYYSPGTSKKYYNRYHLLGLSADLGWNFLYINKAPLGLDLGLSYSRLINTNGLIYDHTLPGFYTDRSAYNNGQLFFNGGLNFQFYSNKRIALEVNPFASVSLTRVFHASDSSKLQYSNLGIKFRVLLKK